MQGNLTQKIKKKIKIILADPLLPKSGLMEMNYPNIGILYIINYLRHKSVNADIFYLSGKTRENDYLEIIKEKKPEIFGLSFASFGAAPSYQTAEKVRKILPDSLFICGGPHPTISSENVLKNSTIDICVIGEGERTMLEIIDFISCGKKLRHIDGIAFLEEGNVHKTNNRDVFRSLDEIPFPAWDLVNFDIYAGPPLCKSKPGTAILASRGCPYNCSFCSNPVWRVEKPWTRQRSPENIASEVQELYDMGIREIYIRSDEMNINEKWPVEVCGAIQNLNLPDMAFQANLTCDKVPESLAKAFSDINCWLIHLGIESANQRVLDGIKKKQTIQQVVNACKVLKKRGIKVFGFFMMFQAWEENGKLCYETVEEVENTLSFIKNLVRQGLLDYISWQVATPIPGAPLYNVAKKYGLITVDEYNPESNWDFNMKLPGIGEREMKRIRRQGMMLQGRLALRNGGINWKNFVKIKNKIRYLIKSV